MARHNKNKRKQPKSELDQAREQVKPGFIDVVVGGGFGSESKGRVTAEVVRNREAHGGIQIIAYRVAGPNAGHVVYDEQGNKFALRAVPVAAAVSDRAVLVIAPGSEIDIDVLRSEVEDLEAKGHRVRDRLYIHPSATIITAEHKEAEQTANLVGRIGSTGKGIGAARAARIMRVAPIAWDVKEELGGLGRVLDITETVERLLSGDRRMPLGGVMVPELAEIGFDQTVGVVIEGTQGYGLGLHTQFYPKVTSSDCRAIDFLAMAGLSPWLVPQQRLFIYVVARPNPIRVAGDSGPLEGETTWEELGLPEERTTVTKKVRRVGAWDPELVRDALAANGHDGYAQVILAMAMVDHVIPGVAGLQTWEDLLGAPKEVQLELWQYLMKLQLETGAKIIGCLGTGPTTTLDIMVSQDALPGVAKVITKLTEEIEQAAAVAAEEQNR